MAKRTLESTLATKGAPVMAAPLPMAPAAAEKPLKEPDNRLATSLRLPPDLMIELKVLAVRQRTRVNDVIIDAIRNHLKIHARDTAHGAAA
jgi:hypothetical protein